MSTNMGPISTFVPNFLSAASECFDSLIEQVFSKIFFVGFTMPPEKVVRERMEALQEKGAQKIDLGASTIDARFIPCARATDQIILFALTHPYQDCHPRYYDRYKESADVVLWNTTKTTSRQYESDLYRVVSEIRRLHPEKKIGIIARCATVDPAISVAHRMQDQGISLVLDRGYGDVHKLARSFTLLAELPTIKKLLTKEFDCQGIEKMTQVPGKVLISAPKPLEDQVARVGKENLTYDLWNRRQANSHPEDQFIHLPNSGHWTRWSKATQQTVDTFLGVEAPVDGLPEDAKPPSYFKKAVLPYLIKSWC